MNGWINLFKPKGISSAKLLSLLKKKIGSKVKIGHTGTLDPLAYGVLPVCVGEATKLSSYMVDETKGYKFVIKFGYETTTGDLEGDIISEESSDFFPSKEECLLIEKEFQGLIIQKPPKYSAIKINGNRAYKLAREGVDFDIPEREVNIYSIKNISYDDKEKLVGYHINCSKGTYVRSIASDIARFLGSRGFVVDLCRDKVGPFDLSSCSNLDNDDNLDILPLDIVLANIPAFNVSDEEADKIRKGQTLIFKNSADFSSIRLYNNNILLAIASINQDIVKVKRGINLI